jgi:hypothetical protein
VPSFTAFAVTKLLRDHFGDFVETDFTAEMEEDLDEISRGEREMNAFLKEFYYGDKKHRGLLTAAERGAEKADYPVLDSAPTPRAASRCACAWAASGRSSRSAKAGPGARRRCPKKWRRPTSPSNARWSWCAPRPRGRARSAPIRPPRSRCT